MSFKDQLTLLHIFVFPFMALALLNLRYSQAEKSYDLNRRWCGFLLPGKWKEKEYFVLWTRRMSFFWLTLLLFVYSAGLKWIFDHRV